MRITILLVTLLCSLTLCAQKRNRDVVYLKNGSILRGTILLADSVHYIKLKTPDRNVWVIEKEKIDNIVVRPSKIPIPQKSGYFNLTEMGVLVGNSANYKKNPFTLMNINSWKFENGFSTGIGVGVEFFNETYLPVVADFRYYLRKSGAIPYVSLQGGYSIPLGGTYSQQQIYYASPYFLESPIYFWDPPSPATTDVSSRGGWLLNPAIGIQTPLNENLALTFSAGYRMMRQRYGKNDTYKLDVDYNRLSLKVGLLFK
jgi:hypothetical protein